MFCEYRYPVRPRYKFLLNGGQDGTAKFARVAAAGSSRTAPVGCVNSWRQDHKVHRLWNFRTGWSWDQQRKPENWVGLVNMVVT
ncbi:hypothetical protein OROGR_015422 [Orobanche gracilis]